MRGLEGTLAWEPLAQLSSLQTLRLSSNALTGTLSSALAGSAALVDLGVADNRLTGPIPTDWRLPPQLQTLVRGILGRLFLLFFGGRG